MCRLFIAYYSNNILIQFTVSFFYQVFLKVIFKADFIDISCERKNEV